YKQLGTLEDESFLDKKPGTYEDNQAYYHSRRRFDPMRQMREEKVFDDYYNSKEPVALEGDIKLSNEKAVTPSVVVNNEDDILLEKMKTGRKVGDSDEYLDSKTGKKFVLKDNKRVYF
ncbi:MAG: hypothetical protein RLY43_2000, partial [Bacteroidota bacterium]